MVTLILASASPRRHDLIQLLGMPCEIRPAQVNEALIQDSDPAQNVMKTAALKAQAVAAALKTEADTEVVIIGADTAVVLDGRLLGKPAGAAAATAMLRQLRGRQHHVYTGLALIPTATGRLFTDVAAVPVPMRAYTDGEIEAYVASGDPLDKAGAYAIQHPVFQPVSEMRACYAAVVGLPLCHLARGLRRLGHLPAGRDTQVAASCQTYHEYHCPVYEQILAVT